MGAILLASILALGWWVINLRPEAAVAEAPITSATPVSEVLPTSPPASPEARGDDLAIRPDRPIVVSGSVRDTSGTAVDVAGQDHGIVFLSRRNPPRIAASPAVGTYRIEGLEPGDWTVRVDVRGYGFVSVPLTLLPDEKERRFDLVLTRYPRVRVLIEIQLDDANMKSPPTLGWIHPVVQEDPAPDWLDARTARPSQEKRRVDEYLLALHCELPAHVSAALGDRIIDTKEVSTDGQEIVLHVSSKDLESNLGTLRFKVIDSGGLTLDRGLYLLRRNRDDLQRWDEEGLLWPSPTVCRVRPGPVTLEIRATQHASRRFELNIEPGMDLDLGEIVLEQELSIRGRLSSPDGGLMDLANAKLECIPLSGDWRRSLLFGFNDYGTTGTEGRFTIAELERGRYALRARYGHLRGGPIEVSTESGSVENVQLRLMETAEVSIKLPVKREDRSMIAIEDAGGLPAAEELWCPGPYSSFSLVPGHYHVRVVLAGEEIASADFTAVLPKTRVVLERR